MYESVGRDVIERDSKLTYLNRGIRGEGIQSSRNSQFNGLARDKMVKDIRRLGFEREEEERERK